MESHASILGAVLAQQRLRAMARSRISDKTRQMLPPIQSDPPARWLGHGVPVLIPLVFLTLWVWLLLAGAGYPPPRHVITQPGTTQAIAGSPRAE